MSAEWAIQDATAKVNEGMLGNEPGDTNYGRHIESADDLRQNATALTIQTNPEETQQAISLVNRFNGAAAPDWNLSGP